MRHGENMTGFNYNEILQLLQSTNTDRGQRTEDSNFQRDCRGIGGWKFTGQLVSWHDFGLIASEDAVKDSA